VCYSRYLNLRISLYTPNYSANIGLVCCFYVDT
jgi:hypothetical protein